MKTNDSEESRGVFSVIGFIISMFLIVIFTGWKSLC